MGADSGDRDSDFRAHALALLSHFGIEETDPERWLKLCVSLALAFPDPPPNKTPSRKVGRPVADEPKHSLAELAVLSRAFDRFAAMHVATKKRGALKPTRKQLARKFLSDPACEDFSGLKPTTLLKLINVGKRGRTGHLIWVGDTWRKVSAEVARVYERLKNIPTLAAVGTAGSPSNRHLIKELVEQDSDSKRLAEIDLELSLYAEMAFRALGLTPPPQQFAGLFTKRPATKIPDE
jgi:hypothetical protein